MGLCGGALSVCGHRESEPMGGGGSEGARVVASASTRGAVDADRAEPRGDAWPCRVRRSPLRPCRVGSHREGDRRAVQARHHAARHGPPPAIPAAQRARIGVARAVVVPRHPHPLPGAAPPTAAPRRLLALPLDGRSVRAGRCAHRGSRNASAPSPSPPRAHEHLSRAADRPRCLPPAARSPGRRRTRVP